VKILPPKGTHCNFCGRLIRNPFLWYSGGTRSLHISCLLWERYVGGG
jgi:hypothetical protein